MCFRLFYRWWWCWLEVLGEWMTIKIPWIPLVDDVFFHPWDLVACSPDFGLWLWQEPYLEDTLWTWRRTYWQQSFRVVPRMGSFFYSFSGARPGILNKLSSFGRFWRRSEAVGLTLTIGFSLDGSLTFGDSTGGREGTLWTLETVLWAWTEYYDGTTHYLFFGILWIVDGRQHSCIPAVLQVYLSIQLIRVRWLLSCIILHLSHWCTPLIYILSVPKGVKHR